MLANLDAFILKQGFGCNVEITIGDTVPTITSMVEKGAPDIAPEGWVDLLPESHELLLHVFDLHDEAWWIDTIKTSYEGPIIEVFEGAGPTPEGEKA